MTPTRIGLIGRADEPHVVAVAREVEAAGGEAVPLLGRLDQLRGWCVDPGGLRLPDGSRLADLGGLYVRSLPLPLPRYPASGTVPAPTGRWMATWEAARRDHAAAKAIHARATDEGVRVVNPLASFWFHRSKPAADLRFATAGLAVPDGLVTSDPDEVEAFRGLHAEVVYKPVAGGGGCRLLTDEDLAPDRRAQLAAAPAYFQERIVGDDLRVYVLAGQAIAAVRIRTAAIDYRGHEEVVEPIEVGPGLADVACRAAAALGLVFSGVDLKRTDAGDLVVLDANPSPMFLGVQRRTGLPIARALALHLLDGRRAAAPRGDRP